MSPVNAVVVKLGGSTAGHDELQQWIEVLATARFPLVVVPGGGPFADEVRALQKPLAYSDDVAHDMAILAMDQFGLVIAERHERLRPCRSLQAIRQTLDAGDIPVWLPSQMTWDAQDIPRSWEVTSDSLAAWFCGQWGAKRLLLIKQTNIFLQHISLSGLVRSGIVDPLLPDMLGHDIALHLAGPQTLGSVAGDLPLADIPGVIMRNKIADEGEMADEEIFGR
ncbi:dihydroneopterin aldolase [Phyllobacterium phragmitis]|uniref:Dihydroneopterin aldolase n=1 Tax=Phyllobacterium phragmitis TaxID=2670329 RepID=A0A2S9ILS4_9HYPH|nr:dihydroneopterin aldolase [Phyllobacterium phragmitis]PRD41468.1 dihydroneopterin aldolase [Phyllobacterium phragmitis]